MIFETIFTPFDFISGIFSNIILIIGVIASISVILKYYRTRKRDFLLFSITILVLIEPWMPSGISFIVALFTYGEGLPAPIYIFIGNAFIPIGLITWTIIFTDLILIDKQKIVLLIVILFSTVFEIHLFYFLFTNNHLMIGDRVGATDINYENLQMIFLSIILMYILITGITFGIETLKTNEPELKIKGRLMIVGFSSFIVFGAIDTIITWNEIALVLIRILGIFAAFSLYGGFFLPNWMRRIIQEVDSFFKSLF
ncbi:MAG: hypothetical protein ACFFBP_14840 [Promethearchaeota archaeon]